MSIATGALVFNTVSSQSKICQIVDNIIFSLQQSWTEQFAAWFRRAFGDPNAYQKIHGEKVIVHEQYNQNGKLNISVKQSKN